MTAPTLRPDQLRMVRETAAHFRAGRRGVLNVAPTGSGKGELIRHWLSECVRWERRALFAVHLGEIVRDVRRRILAAGIPAASVRTIMGAESDGPDDAPITVASWQTLAAREVALDVHLVIADEAHRSKARTCLTVLDRHRAARLLGFTATGQRGDGSGLGPVGYERIVAGPQIAELVAAGHLAPCRVIAPDEYVEALAWEPEDAYCNHAKGRPAIFFCSSIPHSRDVAAALVARGVRALHVDSDVPARQRAAALAALEAGDVDCLCNFRLFTEGLNVRRIEVVGLASAFSHDGPCLQSIGRGRRPSPETGKTECLVLDLRGNIWRRGFPDDDRVYSLDGVGCRSATALTAASQCRSCLGWTRPAAVCPLCGARLPPPSPPRVTRRALREQRLARVRRSGAGWDEWVALVTEARARGWKPQAAAMRWKAKHGAWPRFTVAMVPEAAREEGAA